MRLGLFDFWDLRISKLSCAFIMQDCIHIYCCQEAQEEYFAPNADL